MRNRTSRMAGLLAAAALLAAWASAGAGGDYYVSPSGSDSSAGDQLHPWLTLQHAADTVAAGDSVNVLAGTYAGFHLTASGAEGTPITFRAGSGVTINAHNPASGDGIYLDSASWVIVEGFRVESMVMHGILSTGNNHVTVRNNRLYRNDLAGVQATNTLDLLVENNEVWATGYEDGVHLAGAGDRAIIRGNALWDNAARGIRLSADLSYGGSGVMSNVLVEKNVIYDSGYGLTAAIECTGLQGSIIRNNLLYDNDAGGISLYRGGGSDGSRNNQITNNTIVLSTLGKWGLDVQQGSTGNQAYNNILAVRSGSGGSISISPDSLDGFVSDYNAVVNRFTLDGGSTVLTLAQWQAAAGQDNHSLTATLKQLFPYGSIGYPTLPPSPAINAGTATNAPPEDIGGRRRPYGMAGLYDIGAYEYVIVADLNYDGQVSFCDYQILEQHFGITTGATYWAADVDRDGDVDFADYGILEQNYGSSIPEPGTLWLVAVAGCWLMRRRRCH